MYLFYPIRKKPQGIQQVIAWLLEIHKKNNKKKNNLKTLPKIASFEYNPFSSSYSGYNDAHQ